MPSLVFLLLITSTAAHCLGDSALSQQRILAIANAEVTRQGYALDALDYWISRAPSRKIQHPPELSFRQLVNAANARLNGREYWTLYYSPKKDRNAPFKFGGDIIVFIDAHSGAPLLVVFGK